MNQVEDTNLVKLSVKCFFCNLHRSNSMSRCVVHRLTFFLFCYRFSDFFDY